jgi:crotonobetainyl-CoA:carnitine CoA-transferase CaiB-like acyl-CoA transferase
MGRLWPCADGQVAIGMMQPVEFIALAKAVGLPELAADKRFHGVGGRMKYRDEWAPKLAAAIKSRTKAELMAGFIAEGAVGGLVNTCAEAVNDPQVVHNDVVIQIDHGAAGKVRAARPPARFSATPAAASGPAPRLGEHGAAVLARLGYDAEAIARFVASGAVTGV